MMTDNVGTATYPVSRLHQRTVALLYDELTRPRYDWEETPLKVRLEPQGELSHDIRADVETVKMPDEWTSVGGVVPDLICYNADDKPVRIIEVVVTSPPSNDKQAKLENLRKRGVDVVVVTVRDEKDLPELCWVPSDIRFSSWTAKDKRSRNYARNSYVRGISMAYDRAVMDLIKDLTGCSPQVRRQFLNVLRALGDLDSLHPIRRDNPLREQLDSPAPKEDDA